MRTGNNIRQRTDGRFEARYPKGRDQRGRIIYGCCYGRTYEEAAQKREDILRQACPVREMNLLILGAGSHGTELRELARSLNVFRRVEFLDDDPAKGALGPCGHLEQYVREFPIAIPAVGNQALRMRWMAELVQAGFVLPVLIHPTAVVSTNAVIGYGSVVAARATVGPGAVIGKGCILSSGATIGRNTELPDWTLVDCGQVIAK